MADQKENTRAHIFYEGQVQGVGFRYAARTFANGLKLTGWAKNLSDGRVEITVEGPERNIREFCNRTEAEFEGYITGKQIDFSSSLNEFKIFEIRF